MPRVRLPKITPPRAPGLRRGPAEAKTKPQTATKPKDAKATEEKVAAAKGADEKPTAETTPQDAAKADGEKAAAEAKPAAKGTAPAPNMQERMEGLQGWMAEIERKQGRMTYFGAAAALLAVLAAGAALYLAITTKSDSATKSDVDDLSSQVDTLQGAVTKNNQETQKTLNDTVAGLQTSITQLTQKQAQDAANIATLQSQVAAKGAAGAAITPTPGTTVTPTPTTPTKP
jgi:chromosome segregation ATPase